MTTQTPQSLDAHIPWIQATDAHAPQRIELLGQVRSQLDSPTDASPPERAALAERLERWRYQHLNARLGQLEPRDRSLLDALDLAARELSRRPAIPPRQTRWVLQDEDFAIQQTALVEECLDPACDMQRLAERAKDVTIEHFPHQGGPEQPEVPTRRMLLYAPLYLSSYCINHCTYCGFRYPLDIPRKHLTVEQAVEEAELLTGRGFRHLLLVGGDFPSMTTTSYYGDVLRALRERGIETAVEIAPLPTDEYAQLVEAGACGVTLYQETYQEGPYREVHPKGPKASFDWRLEGLDRAAEAGMQRLGIGILLGLADPIEDLRALVRHGHYLQTRYPDRTIAFSLPRIHEAPEGFQPAFAVDDELFVRMYCALRLAFPTAELVLSTRESVQLRDRLAMICITQMSAGSSTTPGGYKADQDSVGTGEQFPVTDQRPVEEVAAWLESRGFGLKWSAGTPGRG